MLPVKLVYCQYSKLKSLETLSPGGGLGRTEGEDLAAFEANVGQEDEPPAARIFVGATTQCDAGFAL